ncbi:hypothetical protein RF11_08185 [Thelohanellus kitauei]|uniref:Uncharacterized protein n=1 Tax=Thelohanellus kitauei TaxID=669202 RepID=A0A0C2NBT2_THEKT|nr:hypothetical protein RF11_08185 [Thelohanellus kitauei]
MYSPYMLTSMNNCPNSTKQHTVNYGVLVKMNSEKSIESLIGDRYTKDATPLSMLTTANYALLVCNIVISTIFLKYRDMDIFIIKSFFILFSDKILTCITTSLNSVSYSPHILIFLATIEPIVYIIYHFEFQNIYPYIIVHLKRFDDDCDYYTE